MNTAASMYKSYTPLPVQSGLLDLQCRSRSQLYTKRLTDNNPYSNGPGHLGHQKTTSMPGNLEKVVISSNSDSCKQESLEKTLHCLEQTSENSPFCVTCIKFKQELEKMTIQQKKLNEKCSASEKHLKQFDSLLQIKDNRLKEKEKSLQNELVLIESEKQKILEEKSKISADKEDLLTEKKKLEGYLDDINRKYLTVSTCSNEIVEIEKVIKRKPENTQNENVYYTQEDEKLSFFHSDFKDQNDYLLSPFVSKKLSPYKESARITEYLNELKEKNEKELKMKTEELESIKKNLLNKEENIERQQKFLDGETEKLKNELKSIEETKLMLNKRQEDLNNELNLLKEKYEAKLAEEIRSFSESKKADCKEKSELEENPNKKLRPVEEVEKIIKVEKIPNINVKACPVAEFSFSAKNRKFDSRHSLRPQKMFTDEQLLKDFANDESNSGLAPNINMLLMTKSALELKIIEMEKQGKLKDSFYQEEHEKLLTKVTHLEQVNEELQSKTTSLKEENSKLMNLNTNLERKKKKMKTKLEKYVEFFGEIKENSPSNEENINYQIKIICNELQQKLSKLKSKEEEVISLENELNKEQESIISTSLQLKTMILDFEKEKNNFSEDKEKFYQQKLALIELEKQQVEKNKILNMKKEELLKLKKNLNEKESLISLKDVKVTSNIYKRLNTSLPKLFRSISIVEN